MSSKAISAVLVVYKKCAWKASRSLVASWTLILGSVLAYVAFDVSLRLFAPLGLAGGMLAGMIQLLLLSLYLSWIRDVVSGDKLKFDSMWRLDYGVFISLLNVAFVLWIFLLLIKMSTSATNAVGPMLVAQLAIVLVFNALPEVVYNNRVDGMEGLVQTARFVRDHWIEWYIPLIVLVSPRLLQSADGVLIAMAQLDPLMPALIVVQAAIFAMNPQDPVNSVLALLIGTIIGNWFMLFRGFLFRSLESGEHRRRF